MYTAGKMFVVIKLGAGRCKHEAAVIHADILSEVYGIVVVVLQQFVERLRG